jgi:DinB superfamily
LHDHGGGGGGWVMTTGRSGLPPLAGETHVCEDCGLTYGDLAVHDAVAEIRGIPDAARAGVAAVPEGALRLRPSAGVWSVAEYVCHLRDVYASFTIRLRRIRTEDEPQVDPMFGDLRAVRFRYADADVGAVLAELERVVAGFCDEVADTRAEEWSRTLRRLPEEVRTASWLVRHAAHEGRHHVRDIKRVGRTVTSRPPFIP